MENTITIQLTNKKTLKLIQELEALEALQLIKILKENLSASKAKLSDKYKGVFTKEDAMSFKEHTKSMRGEWDRI
ncbi:hypothetical protein G3O08_08445 [Cryomorpha ignava]|uniref:Uncharacterized protein n=1 Tax=Cryomorpha ignava TaxID=101383 RepID=A0A7K3WPW3_9FLAO|nr:hypothetical protein [Cryomorpha ignava]NEN23528.1 hypothetical protein [Cryomorpha ignava]